MQCIKSFHARESRTVEIFLAPKNTFYLCVLLINTGVRGLVTAEGASEEKVGVFRKNTDIKTTIKPHLIWNLGDLASPIARILRDSHHNDFIRLSCFTKIHCGEGSLTHMLSVSLRVTSFMDDPNATKIVVGRSCSCCGHRMTARARSRYRTGTPLSATQLFLHEEHTLHHIPTHNAPMICRISQRLNMIAKCRYDEWCLSKLHTCEKEPTGNDRATEIWLWVLAAIDAHARTHTPHHDAQLQHGTAATHAHAHNHHANTPQVKITFLLYLLHFIMFSVTSMITRTLHKKK